MEHSLALPGVRLMGSFPSAKDTLSCRFEANPGSWAAGQWCVWRRKYEEACLQRWEGS